MAEGGEEGEEQKATEDAPASDVPQEQASAANSLAGRKSGGEQGEEEAEPAAEEAEDDAQEQKGSKPAAAAGDA